MTDLETYKNLEDDNSLKKKKDKNRIKTAEDKKIIANRRVFTLLVVVAIILFAFIITQIVLLSLK